MLVLCRFRSYLLVPVVGIFLHSLAPPPTSTLMLALTGRQRPLVAQLGNINNNSSSSSSSTGSKQPGSSSTQRLAEEAGRQTQAQHHLERRGPGPCVVGAASEGRLGAHSHSAGIYMPQLTDTGPRKTAAAPTTAISGISIPCGPVVKPVHVHCGGEVIKKHGGAVQHGEVIKRTVNIHLPLGTQKLHAPC